MLEHLSTAAEIIRAEIARSGMISFARFMELALYCPVCGYYEKESDTIGRRGDFYTSVSVGSLFGELLGFQFAAWLQDIKTSQAAHRSEALRIVEAGAHDARLANDVLSWLQLRRPELACRIEYWIIEPSARRQQRQRETLKAFGPQVRWFESLAPLHAARITGVLFANELLDAMPVHRLGWDGKRREWFEWGVTIEGDRFAWTRIADSHVPRLEAAHPGVRTSLSALRDLPPELLDALPDGFTTETCPVAESWWRDAAAALDRGKLLAIDYGLPAEELFSPQRKDGTLRAYYRHRPSADVLANPGEQDLTAHVNFTAIQSAGEQVGLKTERLDTQSRFLTEIGGHAWNPNNNFGEWTPDHTREFQTLTHPEHLGRSFRVLIQAR